MSEPHTEDAAISNVLRFIHGHFWTRALSSAVDLAVFDHLAHDALSAGDLAARTGASEQLLKPVLEALVWAGLLTSVDGIFTTTTAGRLLVRSEPLAALALLNGQSYIGRTSSLTDRLRGREEGRSLWVDLVATGRASLFSEVTQENTSPVSAQLARMLDLPANGKVVDLGAGSGALISAVSDTHPNLDCVAFEMDGLDEVLRSNLSEHRRVQVIAGDFFQAVPYADTYILKSVLHNWSDLDCEKILRVIRAENPNAQVRVVERADVPVNEDAVVEALAMVSLFGAPVRFPDDYQALLEAAGFGETAIIETGFDFCVVRGVSEHR